LCKSVINLPQDQYERLAPAEVGKAMLEKNTPDVVFFGACTLVWGLSELVVLLLNEKRRAVHDYIAGTVVIVE
jgi:hypothetical protein